MTSRETYRPPLASEKLLAGPPYKGCRVSSIWHAVACATLGESTMTGFGRVKGKAGRRADLAEGWRAFATQAVPDSNGTPDNNDVVLIQRAMFGPNLPNPRIVETTDFDDVWEDVGNYAVSIALRLSSVAGTELAKYTTADHQVVMYRTKGEKALVIDPMHEHSDLWTGHWCAKGDIRKAAKALGEGTVYAELYPFGGWTRAAAVAREMVDMAQRKDARIKTLEQAVDVQRAKAQAMEEALAECEADCDETGEAAREQLLDELHEWEVAHRE